MLVSTQTQSNSTHTAKLIRVLAIDLQSAVIDISKTARCTIDHVQPSCLSCQIFLRPQRTPHRKHKPRAISSHKRTQVLPDMKGGCECSEPAAADSRQGSVLQPKGWERVSQICTLRYVTQGVELSLNSGNPCYCLVRNIAP
jgi:hypothetical protein